MRIDSPISLNAIITGSFTGSFLGDGTNLTGVIAEWDGSHTGNASIDGDLTVSNLITAGNVDGVDVSSLKDSVDANTTAIAGLDSTYATDAQLSSVSGALASDVAANTSAIAGLDSTYATDAALSSVSGALASDVAANTSAIAGLDSTYATDAALSAHATATDNPHSVTKTQVGLGNVDNTSDANKPVSTATQTALDLKAPLASPTFTGTVIAPTPTSNDSSTKVATTAYVQGEITDLIGGAGAAFDTLIEISASIANGDSDVVALTTTVSGKLQKDQNLSDLTNSGTARTNLGLGTAATTDSTAYATAAQGTKADTAHGWGDHSLVGYLTSYTDTNTQLSDADIAAFGYIKTYTDTNTTYTAGTGLTLTGTVFSNDITNNNQLTNGAGYITSYVNTTYSAGTGVTLTGTTFSIGQAVATNSNVSFASVTATGNITAYSDASLKKDVKTIEGALDKTKALRGVEFTRIADDAKSIGVIAQELETVLPELVVTDDKGIKAVNYAQITGLLIEAVKELSAKVDELSK